MPAPNPGHVSLIDEITLVVAVPLWGNPRSGFPRSSAHRRNPVGDPAVAVDDAGPGPGHPAASPERDPGRHHHGRAGFSLSECTASLSALERWRLASIIQRESDEQGY